MSAEPIHTTTAEITGTWGEEIHAYVQHLRQDLNRSPGTIRLRRNHLTRAACYLGGSPWDATPAQLLDWLAQCTWAPESRKSAQASLRSFYAWAQLTDRIGRSPARALPAVAIPRAMPRPIPDHVTRAALQHADARERLLVLLAAYGGLRCRELSQVHSDDLIGDQLVVRGKGGHERVVPILDEELRRAIASAGGFLFPGRVEGHLSANYVSKVLSRLLPGHWTGHKLRHRALTVAYATTQDLRAVQELAGHASSRTTETYTLVSGKALRAAALAATGLR